MKKTIVAGFVGLGALLALSACSETMSDAPSSMQLPQQGTLSSASGEAPEGIVYCGGGGIKRQIEYAILDNASDQWNARVTVNGDTQRAMTSYSYFGNSEPTKGFVVALLAEDRSEFLVFKDGSENWLEFCDYRYDQCN